MNKSALIFILAMINVLFCDTCQSQNYPRNYSLDQESDVMSKNPMYVGSSANLSVMYTNAIDCNWYLNGKFVQSGFYYTTPVLQRFDTVYALLIYYEGPNIDTMISRPLVPAFRIFAVVDNSRNTPPPIYGINVLFTVTPIVYGDRALFADGDWTVKWYLNDVLQTVQYYHIVNYPQINWRSPVLGYWDRVYAVLSHKRAIDSVTYTTTTYFAQDPPVGYITGGDNQKIDTLAITNGMSFYSALTNDISQPYFNRSAPLDPAFLMQWYINGQPIPGATQQSLYLSNTRTSLKNADSIVKNGDSIYYTVSVPPNFPHMINPAGSTSPVIFTSYPVILSDPYDRLITDMYVKAITPKGETSIKRGLINNDSKTVTFDLRDIRDSFWIKFDSISISQFASLDPGLARLKSMSLNGQDTPVTVRSKYGASAKWTIKFKTDNIPLPDADTFSVRLDSSSRYIWINAGRAIKNITITILDANQGVMFNHHLISSRASNLPIDVSGYPSGTYTVLLNRGLWSKYLTTRPSVQFSKF